MIRFSDERLDYFLSEDVPYFDLTSEILGITEKPAEMDYYTREGCVLAGVDEVMRIARSLGCSVQCLHESGERVAAGKTFMRVSGRAGDIHQLWKVGLNLFDHLSAVATKTRAMVDDVQSVNPRCAVLTTRKVMPGCKDLLLEAIMVGGAYPHRLGLSETVLVFDHHIDLLGGFDEFVRQLPGIRSRCIEKKLFVEADPDHALALARAGVDGLQLDKIAPAELTPLVEELRALDPRITLIATGGITPHNAAEYAATGVDGIATTALYTAKPLDMSVRINAL